MKDENLYINKSNIHKYFVEQKDLIFQHSKLNKDGFPQYYPTKDYMNKRIILSFIDAKITKDGVQIDDEIANFHIYDNDKYDAKESNAATKLKFIMAFFDKNLVITGAIYFKGEYFTYKMNKAVAKPLMKDFFNNYFHLEDGPTLLEHYSKENDARIPYWPTKSYDPEKSAVFSSVRATISSNDDSNVYNVPDFDIFRGDVFDLNNNDDIKIIDAIRSLLQKDKTCDGLYYKGSLLPKHFTSKFRLYLEKSFIRNNFVVEQRDFIFSFATKDSAISYPLFWPNKNASGKKVILSVVNSSGLDVDKELTNFDVLEDEIFNLHDELYQRKLKLIVNLLNNKAGYNGALYIDGILSNGQDNQKSDIQYRIEKFEKISGIYLVEDDDFVYINHNFTSDDKDRLLNVSSIYDKYYPRSFEKVPNKDKEFEKGKYLLRFERANIIDSDGNYLYEKDFDGIVSNKESLDKDASEFLKQAIKVSNKIKGGIYLNGKLIRNDAKEVLKAEFNLSNDGDDVVNKHSHIYDKKSKMPIYWPTKDNDGRKVLLSVVDGDVVFKSGRNVVRACSNVSFNIYEGETLGLVGESGSGKTTISRAILGINKIDKGGIYYKGRLISSKLSSRESKLRKKNIQMIFQDPAASLNERANVDYIISEGLYNFKLFSTKEERIAKVSRMLKSVGLLPEHLSRYPHEFSGGQRQRIGIARALAIEPQLVLADEPISALDVSIRAQVLNLLKKLQAEQGLTYLFIAHDLSIIRYISDRIAVMHKGYIVELGNAEEIYSNPLHPYTKSLLTAIPQPDPKTKDKRVRKPLKLSIDYSKCKFKEYKDKHYVLVDESLEEQLDKKYQK